MSGEWCNFSVVPSQGLSVHGCVTQEIYPGEEAESAKNRLNERLMPPCKAIPIFDVLVEESLQETERREKVHQ